MRTTGLVCCRSAEAVAAVFYVLGLAVFEAVTPTTLAVFGRRFPTLLLCAVPPAEDLLSATEVRAGFCCLKRYVARFALFGSDDVKGENAPAPSF